MKHPEEPAVSRVLVIDDDPVITAIYERLLRIEGYEVEIAGDGEQGLESVRRFKPDVVLLDLDMPKVSGLAWLRKIRSRAKGKTLPVVILTAGTTRRQLREAKKSDASIMLSKTAIHPKTVVEAINLAAGRLQTMT